MTDNKGMIVGVIKIIDREMVALMNDGYKSIKKEKKENSESDGSGKVSQQFWTTIVVSVMKCLQPTLLQHRRESSVTSGFQLDGNDSYPGRNPERNPKH